MGDSIPTTNPAEFGSYANYLAARVDGLSATWGMSRTETAGQFVKTEKDEGGGGESVEIGKDGNFAILSAGSLRGLLSDLWGGGTWKEMCGMDVFSANKADTDAHRMALKPLSFEARAIADKLSAPKLLDPEQPLAEPTTTNPGGDLDGEARCPGQGGWGRGGGAEHPCRPGRRGWTRTHHGTPLHPGSRQDGRGQSFRRCGRQERRR